MGQTAQLYFRPVVGEPAADRPTTPREENDPKAEVVLPEMDREGNVVARYVLVPRR